jgi:MSHA biogenesis protein MshO
MLCPERPLRNPQRGATLIEMVIVIVICALIAGGVAVFISRPFEGYVDAARRAELTDVADTALRRITRDLRSALPNSIRLTCVPAGCTDETTRVYYLEYLQTRGGGRYRADKDSAGNGDELRFNTTDTSFDVVGPSVFLAAGDSIVIYNLASSGTVANAYSDDTTNNRSVSSSTGTVNNISVSSKQFPYPSPGKRFHIVEHPVTYECNPTTGELRRHWGYPIAATQTPLPPTGGSVALLANAITRCSFTYNTTSERTSVVGLAVRVERNGEFVRLFQQVHVSNVP